MRAVVALALSVAWAVPVLSEELPPLVEARRIPFERPFEMALGGTSNAAIHPTAPVAYATGDRHLFVIDAVTGEELDRLLLDALVAEPGAHRWTVHVVGERLLVSASSAGLIAVFDIEEPAVPELLRSEPFGNPVVVGTHEAGFFLVRHLDGQLDLVTVETLQGTGAVPHVFSPYSRLGGTAIGGAVETPVLSVVERESSTGGRTALAVYDVPGGVPQLRFWREIVTSPGGLVLDRSGDLLVALFEVFQTPRRRYVEAIDARTGATLSAWDIPATGTSRQHLVLAEGGGRWLVVVDDSGFDVVDLADPSAPRPVGRVDAAQVTGRDGREVAPSRTEPLLVATSGADRAVLAVDPRTAAEIARLPMDDAIPAGLVLQEAQGAIRRAVVVSRRTTWDAAVARGGLAHLDMVDVANPAAPAATGRFLSNHPSAVEGVGAVGGRYGLVYQHRANALALVDLAAGRVVQVTGAAAPLGEFDVYDAPEMRSTGRFALLGGWRGWERFELVGGRLEPVDARITDSDSWDSYEAVELAPDGTVAALGWSLEGGYFLETVGPDGASARVPREYSRLLQTSLSPAGDLLAVSMPEFEVTSPVAVWDVANPAAPLMLWRGLNDVSDAVFDPTGTRLLVSGPIFDATFQVQALDARSGAPLGDVSEEIEKFYYHGFGAQWIADGAWRAVYWEWSWCGWSNAIVDLGGPAPSLLRIEDFTGSFPEFAPREDGGWYEVRRDPWDRLAKVVVGAPDGTTSGTGVIEGDHEGIASVRRGFFTTVRQTVDSFGVSLWRDTARNRAPVVVATGGGELECTDHDGARVQLAATGSFDPDSAPGTQDDLAGFGWWVDGSKIALTPVTETMLPPGSHEARVEVVDVLGATSSLSLPIAVVDRAPADVAVTMAPLLEGQVFAGAFGVVVDARDACDPAPAASTHLEIPSPAAGAPVSWIAAATSAVEVRTSARGPEVVVLGPSEAEARAAWNRAVQGGAMPMDTTARLELGGESRRVLWRLELAGGLLTRAVAYGGGDLVVRAVATDASGNAASASASLLAARAAACAALPPGGACPER